MQKYNLANPELNEVAIANTKEYSSTSSSEAFDQDKWFEMKKMQSSPTVCSELYDFSRMPSKNGVKASPPSKLKNFFPREYKMHFNFKGIDQNEPQLSKYLSTQPCLLAPTKFTEKHLIESLNVGLIHPKKPIMFYSMLNQGNKRGKETQVLALDCERIRTEEGERLARVSIVNFYGNIVFDTLVKPCDYHDQSFKVLDYREWITGIKPIDLAHAPSFSNIEPILKKIVRNKTIVGHSLADDLAILKLDVT